MEPELGLGLSTEDLQLAPAFREHRRAAYWPVEGYRFRLAHEFEAAVAYHAPLTAAVLHAHGYPLSEIAERFGSHVGWRDYGRCTGRATRDLLAFIADTLAEAIVGLRDVVLVETIKLDLLARLADLPAKEWAAPKHTEALDETCRYRCSPAAALVRIDRDLSPWLEAPERAAQCVPAIGLNHLIVYLNSLDEPPQYAGLNGDTATVFATLEQPLALHQIAAHLGTPPAIGRARHAMNALIAIQVIRKDPSGLYSSAARS